jgi:hypothetical protein
MLKPHSGPGKAELAGVAWTIQPFILDIVQAHATVLAWKHIHMTCLSIIRFPEFKLSSVH